MSGTGAGFVDDGLAGNAVGLGDVHMTSASGAVHVQIALLPAEHRSQ